MSTLEGLGSKSRELLSRVDDWEADLAEAARKMEALLAEFSAVLSEAFAIYELYCAEGCFPNTQYAFGDFEQILAATTQRADETLRAAMGLGTHMGHPLAGLATLKAASARAHQILAENKAPTDTPGAPSQKALRDLATRNPPPADWYQSSEEQLF